MQRRFWETLNSPVLLWYCRTVLYLVRYSCTARSDPGPLEAPYDMSVNRTKLRQDSVLRFSTLLTVSLLRYQTPRGPECQYFLCIELPEMISVPRLVGTAGPRVQICICIPYECIRGGGVPSDLHKDSFLKGLLVFSTLSSI